MKATKEQRVIHAVKILQENRSTGRKHSLKVKTNKVEFFMSMMQVNIPKLYRIITDSQDNEIYKRVSDGPEILNGYGKYSKSFAHLIVTEIILFLARDDESDERGESDDSQDIFDEHDSGEHSETLPDGQEILNGYEHNAGKYSKSLAHLIVTEIILFLDDIFSEYSYSDSCSEDTPSEPFNWPKAQREGEDEQVKGRITHIDARGYIYLHPTNKVVEFDKIRDELQEICSSRSPHCGLVFPLQRHYPCYAKRCGFYARARVVSVEEDFVTVKFIDHGNKHVFNTSELILAKEFKDIPSLAVKYKLKNATLNSAFHTVLSTLLHYSHVGTISVLPERNRSAHFRADWDGNGNLVDLGLYLKALGYAD